jgi:hypothetical protein
MMYTGMATLNGQTKRFYVEADSALDVDTKIRMAHSLVHGNRLANLIELDSIEPHRNIVWQGA